MHGTLSGAVEQATRMANLKGESYCIVSGTKDRQTIYRIYPLAGFGLPPGGTLERVIEPVVERIDTEPPEKTSANGF